jgi:hypothetical protein
VDGATGAGVVKWHDLTLEQAAEIAHRAHEVTRAGVEVVPHDDGVGEIELQADGGSRHRVAVDAGDQEHRGAAHDPPPPRR